MQQHKDDVRRPFLPLSFIGASGISFPTNRDKIWKSGFGPGCCSPDQEMRRAGSACSQLAGLCNTCGSQRFLIEFPKACWGCCGWDRLVWGPSSTFLNLGATQADPQWTSSCSPSVGILGVTRAGELGSLFPSKFTLRLLETLRNPGLEGK